MARTTVDLDPSVLRKLRKRSRREHKTMGQLASELLARGLSEPAPDAGAAEGWRTWNMGVPRVDLEDKEAARAALEGQA